MSKCREVLRSRSLRMWTISHLKKRCSIGLKKWRTPVKISIFCTILASSNGVSKHDHKTRRHSTYSKSFVNSLHEVVNSLNLLKQVRFNCVVRWDLWVLNFCFDRFFCIDESRKCTVYVETKMVTNVSPITNRLPLHTSSIMHQAQHNARYSSTNSRTYKQNKKARNFFFLHEKNQNSSAKKSATKIHPQTLSDKICHKNTKNGKKRDRTYRRTNLVYSTLYYKST